MQTLFIDRKGTEISVESKRLIIKSGLRPNHSFPLKNIERLVISASVYFSSTLLNRLTREGIQIVFIDTRHSNASTTAYGMMHNDAKRRLLQYRAAFDTTTQLVASKAIVYNKVRGQQHTLRKILFKRPDKRLALFKSEQTLSNILTAIQHCEDIDSLRGHEGAAAAIYFNAFTQVFAPSLQFTQRNRRPPKDPVNAILSLTYTLLHSEAVKMLIAVGFDPFIGIYHKPDYGRESLACDFVEILRPHADYWVWRLFAEETLRQHHFTQQAHKKNQACLLEKDGRGIYFPLYAQKSKLWQRYLRSNGQFTLKQMQRIHGESYEQN